eukprot:TRINITY_DN5250_c0_g1_i1.p1 TRINITY_DN5250_c0_g1~~TRINITY_DN5250_c0_g1_i1.p1  ORF type:complete len:795 (-),score=169.28 TRINITY_DN5250_c0_g1_i1:76-2460(-)
MGQLFRSEEMQLVQLFIQYEAAHATVDELGKLGVIQFRDLNPDVNAFQRHFVREVKRADELDRKVRYFADQVVKANLNTAGNSQAVALSWNGKSKSSHIDDLEVHFEQLEADLRDLSSNEEKLNRNYNELIEVIHVLKKADIFFATTGIQGTLSVDLTEEDELKTPLINETGRGAGPVYQKAVQLGFVAGVIHQEKLPNFERVLWRVTRGNMFMKTDEIDQDITDPNTGELTRKSVFVIFFQGERLQQKVKKLCESYGVNLYSCPENSNERSELLVKLEGQLRDLENVLKKTSERRTAVCTDVAANLEEWKERVMKEKAIYHTMNMFNYDVGRQCLIAEGWCPKYAVDDIQLALRTAASSVGSSVPSVLSTIKAHEEPPTFFKTDKFTSSYHAIVESYGVARYQEVNPAVFAIITFPFLFAVMFGDVGHGILLLLFALTLVLKEKEFDKIQLHEMVKTCYDGRYVLLLMAIFSIYTGFMYNECFAIPMDFGSSWEFETNTTQFATQHKELPYPFGVDPVWKGAKNELAYYNSLKMKMSIIFGVSQMTLGIMMQAVNGIHFKKMYNIWFEFIPQLLFLLSLFGYMCVIIFVKWLTNWKNRTPPVLLNTMINIFLTPTSIKPEDELYSGQLSVQQAMIAIAFICVPWMLLVKPLMLRRDHKLGRLQHDDHGEEFVFSEVMVHQVIHTIEFVLGSVSNTASYLRLWALSLAHSELSTVFWELVMILSLKQDNFIFPFVGFAVWAALTIGVLMIMESLSAFLHALRLHWVEFQSKFYLGDGKKFLPFSYERILQGEEV